MCGIVGLIHFRSAVEKDLIRGATSTLFKRGPDDCGIWTLDNVGLGHQRLAILDLSAAGNQPMLSADQRYVLVFNGEIYNFMEIRKRIDGKVERWRSNGDAEVILAAYEKWGTACVHYFHGMFAFAIWDRKDKVLFAARDRMGVKPFYYHWADDCFAFASRPRALLALNPRWSSPFDDQALRLYMECGYVPAPYSVYQAIRKLPPAHWMLLSGNRLHIERYWDFRHIVPDVTWESRDEADLLDELDEILYRSVRSRMISDVPLGGFLSGGIDSSLVVALMAEQSRVPVRTFTIGFEEKAFDESDRAHAVAQYLGTEHYCENLKVDDLLELFPTFSQEYDEPFYDSSAFPTMAVSRLARNHVTVSLSGDGGDELFGGYHYYQIVNHINGLYRMPIGIRKSLAALVGAIPSHRCQLLSRAMMQGDIAGAFCFCRSVIKDFDRVLRPDLVRGTMGMRDFFSEASNAFPPGLTPAEIGMRLDTFYTLPDDYLQKVDIASMAFSLESREPLLDQDVVEFAMKLPEKWKVRRNVNKYLLRKLAYRHVPEEILSRPKQGFSVPIREWLRGPLHFWAENEFRSETAFGRVPLDKANLLSVLLEHCSGKRDAHPLLWSALMLLNFANRIDAGTQFFTPTVYQHGN